MTEKYLRHKKWRLNNPDKRREERKRYYDKTANAANGGADWTLHEIDMVIKHEMSDNELAQKLGRSVRAIQKKRHMVKKNA